MSTQKLIVQLLFFVLFCSCKSARDFTKRTNDDRIEFQIMQINDVYEIAPLEGGNAGGMARIASIKKELLLLNKNTLLVHAGDFLNPSLIGTMKFEGQSIRGRQMVEVMNASGVDLVTFGNHEFDLSEEDLQKRINESDFVWTSANVLHQEADRRQPFFRMKNGTREFFPTHYIWQIQDADGTQARIAFIGVTLPSNPQPYVYYEDYTLKMSELYNQLKDSVELVLALTHLEMEEDLALAAKLPGIPLFLGGHDHDRIYQQLLHNRIAKADANAKSTYVHNIILDTKTKKVEIQSRLIKINQAIREDSTVAVLVNKWNNIAEESFRKDGFDPNEVVAVASEPLDGRESTIRHQQTNLAQIIAAAMAAAASKPPDAAIFNSGSIRVDDQLTGKITQFDIIRTLPFGGGIYETKMTGSLLKKVLDQGLANKGTGGYLQWYNISLDPNLKQKWLVNKKPLAETQIYSVVVNDFLLKGLEAGLEFLTEENPGIVDIVRGNPKDPGDLRNDMRMAVIEYLKNRK